MKVEIEDRCERDEEEGKKRIKKKRVGRERKEEVYIGERVNRFCRKREQKNNNNNNNNK